MTTDKSLVAVAVAAEELRVAKAEAADTIKRLVAAAVAEKEAALEVAVVNAARTSKVVEIARAMLTDPTRTPNRNKVYEILRRAGLVLQRGGASMPLRWAPREIETVTGTRLVYDAVGSLVDFGSESVTGDFRWTYDDGVLTPVYMPFDANYPSTPEYRDAVKHWLDAHPYPANDQIGVFA